MKVCPFCQMPPERMIAEEGPCYAVRDGYPVSEGHALIIPRRHVETFRELTDEEWLAIHRLARDLADRLTRKDATIMGFNLGVNDGQAAGQTVMHAHVHLIPRREGDVPNPRGGVRGVIPSRQCYPKT